MDSTEDFDDQLVLDSQVKLFEKRLNNFQPNVITESKQTFSELEKKIVVLIINQMGDLSMRNEYKSGMNLKFRIPYAELTEKNHSKIEEAASALNDRSYYNRDHPGIDKIKPFPRVTSLYEGGRKYMEITMLSDVVPIFIGLGQRYTKYNLNIMISLNSVYAQRIYELIMMYKSRNQKTFRYTVEKLIYMLNCPDTYSYREVNRWALIPAQSEIERKAGITYRFYPSKKQGKKIIELEFEILTKESIAAQLVEQDRTIINGMSINEAVVTAWQIFKEYKFTKSQKDLIASDPKTLGEFFRIHSEIVNGLREDVKNPTAYMVSSLQIVPGKLAISPKKLIPKSVKKTKSTKDKDGSIGSIIGTALKIDFDMGPKG